MTPSFWNDKTVFLTGHTGFKGGWISHWLYELGASVHGYSLEPPTQPSFFTETQLQRRLARTTVGDIRNFAELISALKQAKPDIIVHMAAQPLVRESYNTPVETFAANVIGTVNLLEAARQVGTAKAIVNITTDKCYENKEWLWPYRENDRLGGHDPYSASKACAEIAAAAYRNSFLAGANIHLASARAGNVIGGGDWATDRLVPDFLRALDAGKTLSIRSPNAVRPWQHVLEPLSGYLMLAEKLYSDGGAFAEAWNFGPNDEDAKSAGWIVERLCALTPGARWKTESAKQPHEAGLLKLDSSKAKAELGWDPRWNLETALSKTTEWHRAWRNREDMAAITTQQIQIYANS
ncbi:MAG: CDP-glucose 4,6-dehydratase [Proteobacteria bacterium]|nr:CDP-glucose 4,6-dehydratase [Pseudomonadota bacterium]